MKLGSDTVHAERADSRSKIPPRMVVQPSMAMRSSTESAVAVDTQQPWAKPAAMPDAAASVSLSLRTELSAWP